jgi:formate dehydrogenase subunit beta
MALVLKIKKSAEQGIKDIFKFMLENRKIAGVFVLKKTNAGSVHYSLITNKNDIDSCLPLHPFMPANAARLLSIFMQKGPSPEPIACMLRPCELRAFVELVKLEQGSLENIFIISTTCPGVYPIKVFQNNGIEKKSESYKKSIKTGEILPELRTTCKGCVYFSPYGSDITISLIGNDIDTSCDIFINTEKAKNILTGMDGDITEEELETKAIISLREKRDIEREKLLSSLPMEYPGLDGLIELFAKCIGCYGCRSACPICYCTLCFFDSNNNESSASVYENEVIKRGAVKVPSNTLFYHLGRMSHIGISCVGCGSCSDVCPVDIPLPAIYIKASRAIQDLYQYLPGEKPDEERPLRMFKEEELTEFES